MALGPLSIEVRNATAQLEELTDVVAELTRRHAQLVRDEKACLDRLAHVYLPELSPEAVFAGLDALQADLEAALQKQEKRSAELEKRLALATTRVSDHRKRVADAEAAEARSGEALDRARASVEALLDEDQEHATWVREHDELIQRRELLKERRRNLARLAGPERARYEADPFFAYLLRRDYGEPEYRSGPVTRRLDRWLARRIEFDELYRRYRILRVGPSATQAEIRRIEGLATELERLMDEREARLGRKTGLLEALEEDAAAQERVLEARNGLEEAETAREALGEELRAVEIGRGGPYQEAIALHTAFLSDKKAQELVDLARTTPDPRDDALVVKLDRIRGELTAVEGQLAERRRELETVESRAAGLGSLARSAASRFTSRRSHFPDGFPVAGIVRGILDGVATVEEALSEIAGAHAREPLLPPTGLPDTHGWFAELSSVFDRELGAFEQRVDQEDSEVVVRDAAGRVIHRRITRRSRDGSR